MSRLCRSEFIVRSPGIDLPTNATDDRAAANHPAIIEDRDRRSGPSDCSGADQLRLRQYPGRRFACAIATISTRLSTNR